jgi:hypothetical protein
MPAHTSSPPQSLRLLQAEAVEVNDNKEANVYQRIVRNEGQLQDKLEGLVACA